MLMLSFGESRGNNDLKNATLARMLMRSLVYTLKLKGYETVRKQWHTAAGVPIVLTFYVLLSSLNLLCMHGYPGM